MIQEIDGFNPENTTDMTTRENAERIFKNWGLQLNVALDDFDDMH